MTISREQIVREALGRRGQRRAPRGAGPLSTPRANDWHGWRADVPGVRAPRRTGPRAQTGRSDAAAAGVPVRRG